MKSRGGLLVWRWRTATLSDLPQTALPKDAEVDPVTHLITRGKRPKLTLYVTEHSGRLQ